MRSSLFTVLVVFSLAALGGCSEKAENKAEDPLQKPNVAVNEEPGTSDAAIPDRPSPSDGCSLMDATLVVALTDSPEGQAFTASKGGDMDTAHAAWSDFVTVFLQNNKAELEASAQDDLAKEALAALITYQKLDSSLSSGEIPEFTDAADAEEAIKLGKEPERNPEFEQSISDLVTAHSTLTRCLPHWPVVF